MAEQIMILFFIGFLFVVIMPFVAIWKIWHILERIEKTMAIASEKLTVLVSIETKKDM
jgi:hypothetical protein